MTMKYRKRKSPIPRVQAARPQFVFSYLAHDETRYIATPLRYLPALADEDCAAVFAFNNFVTLEVPNGCTRRAAIERIAKAAEIPISIQELDPALSKPFRSRGPVWGGHVWRLVDQIALDQDDVYWWVTEVGLSVVRLSSSDIRRRVMAKRKVDSLSSFDRIAGPLFIEGLKENARVSTEALRKIAERLDEEHFQLKKHLLPSDWNKIATYNEKYARRAVRTFSDALPQHSREVRRALSSAKARYVKATRSSLV